VQILIAEDDAVSRRMLEVTLMKWGHKVVSTTNGVEALQILQETNVSLAVLDWMMPEMDGVEVCRKAREQFDKRPLYFILLTAKGRQEDIIAGLEAGADDYVTKPFDRDELQARLNVGIRIVELQSQLSARVRELQEALAHVNELQGLLPICCYCKKIRDDQNYWQHVENYITARSDAQFSHGICPTCYEKVSRPALARAGSKK
jgi:sigma-B regulation protein RsbU (phosphoserine phosphatase)